jgi:hypothetical protein
MNRLQPFPKLAIAPARNAVALTAGGYWLFAKRRASVFAPSRNNLYSSFIIT